MQTGSRWNREDDEAGWSRMSLRSPRDVQVELGSRGEGRPGLGTTTHLDHHVPDLLAKSSREILPQSWNRPQDLFPLNTSTSSCKTHSLQLDF